MTTTQTTYSVYHGGSLYGLGRWSGPHATLRAAIESAVACYRTVGGAPVVYDDLADQRVAQHDGVTHDLTAAE